MPTLQTLLFPFVSPTPLPSHLPGMSAGTWRFQMLSCSQVAAGSVTLNLSCKEDSAVLTDGSVCANSKAQKTTAPQGPGHRDRTTGTAGPQGQDHWDRATGTGPYDRATGTKGPHGPGHRDRATGTRTQGQGHRTGLQGQGHRDRTTGTAGPQGLGHRIGPQGRGHRDQVTETAGPQRQGHRDSGAIRTVSQGQGHKDSRATGTGPWMTGPPAIGTQGQHSPPTNWHSGEQTQEGRWSEDWLVSSEWWWLRGHILMLQMTV